MNGGIRADRFMIVDGCLSQHSASPSTSSTEPRDGIHFFWKWVQGPNLPVQEVFNRALLRVAGKSRPALISAKALSYPAGVSSLINRKCRDHSGETMDTIQKSARRVKTKNGDDTILSIPEKFRKSRSAEHPHTKTKQVKPKRPRTAYPYSSNPCDLNRIAQAESRIEVFDILNQVLQVLHRSGRMAEVPEALRIDCLTTAIQLRIALRKMQGGFAFTQGIDWNSDAMLVLRAILTAANEKFKHLRLQK